MSGKVLEVRFQPGRKDQFTQRYTYDADNRLSAVSTSHDGVIWEQDASYTYYAHGPLRRTVLGRDLVQGLDYTYTIAGWLKGINLPTLSTEYDPGKDGLATGSNPTVGRDAFGMQLHYHNGDFTDGPSAFTGTRSEASFKGLYNGNIAGWSYTSRSENGTPQTTMLSTYSYDKLNRLKQDQPYTMVNNASTVTSKWSSSYSYDLDGNITNLMRDDGNGSGIDNLSYAYPASGGKTINNRLNHIVDHTTGNGGGAGVVTQNPGNYSYDATGNLTADVTEGITSITWTPYNKIRELVKTNAAPATGTTTLRYLYDAAGNRVVKDYHATQNTTLTSRTWYIRDPQGTVLAIYTRKPTAGNGGGSVTRTEAPIYGSSRIGQSTRTATYDATSSGEATLLGTVYSRELGKRAYELVDHLGNVRATISDILVPRTATNTYDADILTLTDYYPFGMQMDTRTWEAGGVAGHRYGYNGKENDDEVKGQGNSLDFGARMYDSKVGRFLSMDPKFGKYPSLSSYSYVAGNPIFNVDRNGEDIYVYGANNLPVCAIITKGPDVAYRVNFLNGPETGGLIIDPSEMAYGADAVGVSFRASFVPVMGANYGVSAVFFVTGQDAGSVAFYANYGASIGLEAGAGASLFASWYVGDRPLDEHSASGYSGAAYGYSGGAGVWGGSVSWALDPEHTGDAGGIFFGPLVMDDADLTYKTYEIGAGLSQLKVGGSWSMTQMNLLGKLDILGAVSSASNGAIEKLTNDEWESVVSSFAPNPRVTVGSVVFSSGSESLGNQDKP